MYGENTNTMAIPIYRVLPYPVTCTICGQSVFPTDWTLSRLTINNLFQQLSVFVVCVVVADFGGSCTPGITKTSK